MVLQGREVTKLISDMTASERFWKAVDKTGECWLWTRSYNWGGYGVFTPPNKAPFEMAHRFSYEECVGPIPAGFEVDHKCRNRGCVKPDHLQAVTRQENMENVSIRADNSSGYRGVSYHKVTGLWMAYGQYRGKNNYLGVYPTAEEAAVVAKEFRMANHTNNLEDRA